MNEKTVSVIKISVLLAILVAVPVLLAIFCRDTLLNKAWLQSIPSMLNDNRIATMCILLTLQIIQVLICIIPGQPIQIASGYLYGIWGGFALSIAGAFIGALAAYAIANLLGARSIETVFGKEQVEHYRKQLNSGKGLYLAFLIYLIPGLPKDIVAYVAGISEMRLKPFLILSTTGRSFGMFGSLILGYYLSRDNYKAMIILSAIAAIILLIFLINRKRISEYLDKTGDKEESERLGNDGKEGR